MGRGRSKRGLKVTLSLKVKPRPYVRAAPAGFCQTSYTGGRPATDGVELSCGGDTKADVGGRTNRAVGSRRPGGPGNDAQDPYTSTAPLRGGRV